MRVLAFHAIFASILIGSLVAHDRDAGVALDGLRIQEQAASLTARSHGLILHERKTNFLNLLLEGDACSQPVSVIFRPITLEDQATIRATPDPGYLRRYVYIDLNSDKLDPWAIWMERAKYELLGVFGLAQYAPSRYLLQVDEPADCPLVETIDWRPVWRRDFLTTIEDNPQATL
jgi:hypothetical protein